MFPAIDVFYIRKKIELISKSMALAYLIYSTAAVRGLRVAQLGGRIVRHRCTGRCTLGERRHSRAARKSIAGRLQVVRVLPLLVLLLCWGNSGLLLIPVGWLKGPAL